MKKLIFPAAVALLLSACGSIPTLDAASASALKGHTVVRSLPPSGKFQMTTPGKVAIGARIVEGLSDGPSYAGEDIANPSTAIAAQLAAELDQRYGTKTVETILTQKPKNIPELTAIALPHAEYALEVSTPGPSMVFYLSSPSKYRVMFTTFAALVELKTQKVLLSAGCTFFADDLPHAATYDEMLADHGKRLKQDLAAGEQFCIQDLRKKIFVI